MHRALVLVLVLAACTATTPHEPGSARDAERHLRRVAPPGGDLAAVKTLRPEHEDYAVVFLPAVAAEFEAAYRPYWLDPPVIAPASDETFLQLTVATSDQMRNSPARYPHYAPIVDLLQPGVTWYDFNFSRPGEGGGTSGHGLIYVRGHWALFPDACKYAPAGLDVATCERFADHFLGLMLAGGPTSEADTTRQVFAGMRPGLITDCRKAKRDEIACALAATSMEALDSCSAAK